MGTNSPAVSEDDRSNRLACGRRVTGVDLCSLRALINQKPEAIRPPVSHLSGSGLLNLDVDILERIAVFFFLFVQRTEIQVHSVLV